MGNKKQYASVSELVRDLSEDRSFADEFERHVSQRRIVKDLFALRTTRGLSQKDIAEKLRCTQSRISKLENGNDDDLRLGDLRDYLDAIELSVNLVVTPKNDTAVNLVKHHAFCIREIMKRLTDLAQGDEKIAKGVADFHGEAFFNLVKMLGDSARQLPRRKDDRPYIQIELMGIEPIDHGCDDVAVEPVNHASQQIACE